MVGEVVEVVVGVFLWLFFFCKFGVDGGDDIIEGVIVFEIG